MSKFEIVKQYANTTHKSEQIETLAQLQQFITNTLHPLLIQNSRDMNELPKAVAVELVTLVTLAEQIDKTLLAQREAFSLVQQETNDRVDKISETLGHLLKEVNDLNVTLSVKKQTQGQTQEQTQKQVQKPVQTKKQVQKKGLKIWQLASVTAIAAAAVALAVTAVGINALNKPAQSVQAKTVEQATQSVQAQTEQATQNDVWSSLRSMQ